MIFLKDNALVERDIIPDDIKPRLLGHWGTCPGLTLVYAHLNRLVSTTGIDALYVVGPGHGAPAILASLWLENSLANFYPKYSRDKAGLSTLISSFSSPGGFPRYSHLLMLFFKFRWTHNHLRIVMSTLRLRGRSTKVASSATLSVWRLVPSWTNPISYAPLLLATARPKPDQLLRE